MAREGEAIENVAEVDHETGDGGGQGADPGGDKLNGEEFHRTGVDDDGEDWCPPPREAGLHHDQAKRQAKRDEAQADEPGVPDATADFRADLRVSCHQYPPGT